MLVNQGKKLIFRPIDKEEREMFHEVTKDLMGVGYDPLAVKLWPINAGDNSAIYVFLCATYPSFSSGRFEINLALVYIAEVTLEKHEFRLEKIERIGHECKNSAIFKTEVSNQNLEGSWLVKALVCQEGMLPENLATGFYEAFQGFVGPKYEVMIYCATQVVNGTNHMLICEGINPHGEKIMAKIVLHETLPESGKVLGHFSIVSIEPIITCGGEGGWTVEPSRWVGGSLPRRLLVGYVQALEGFTGSKIEPLVYCGLQVVNGTNYMLICKTQANTLNAKIHISKVILHEEDKSGCLPGHFSVHSIEEIV